ncbi:MAG: hypothetical protein UY97_C0006G0022, partial [Parcubacteria group bacterium GW2011_GWB1_57_6]
MVGALALAFVLVIGYVFVLAPPRDFPSGD